MSETKAIKKTGGITETPKAGNVAKKIPSSAAGQQGDTGKKTTQEKVKSPAPSAPDVTGKKTTKEKVKSPAPSAPDVTGKKTTKENAKSPTPSAPDVTGKKTTKEKVKSPTPSEPDQDKKKKKDDKSPEKVDDKQGGEKAGGGKHKKKGGKSAEEIKGQQEDDKAEGSKTKKKGDKSPEAQKEVNEDTGSDKKKKKGDKSPEGVQDKSEDEETDVGKKKKKGDKPEEDVQEDSPGKSGKKTKKHDKSPEEILPKETQQTDDISAGQKGDKSTGSEEHSGAATPEKKRSKTKSVTIKHDQKESPYDEEESRNIVSPKDSGAPLEKKTSDGKERKTKGASPTQGIRSPQKSKKSDEHLGDKDSGSPASKSRESVPEGDPISGEKGDNVEKQRSSTGETDPCRPASKTRASSTRRYDFCQEMNEDGYNAEKQRSYKDENDPCQPVSRTRASRPRKSYTGDSDPCLPASKSRDPSPQRRDFSCLANIKDDDNIEKQGPYTDDNDPCLPASKSRDSSPQRKDVSCLANVEDDDGAEKQRSGDDERDPCLSPSAYRDSASQRRKFSCLDKNDKDIDDGGSKRRYNRTDGSSGRSATDGYRCSASDSSRSSLPPCSARHLHALIKRESQRSMDTQPNVRCPPSHRGSATLTCSAPPRCPSYTPSIRSHSSNKYNTPCDRLPDLQAPSQYQASADRFLSCLRKERPFSACSQTGQRGCSAFSSRQNSLSCYTENLPDSSCRRGSSSMIGSSAPAAFGRASHTPSFSQRDTLDKCSYRQTAAPSAMSCPRGMNARSQSSPASSCGNPSYIPSKKYLQAKYSCGSSRY